MCKEFGIGESSIIPEKKSILIKSYFIIEWLKKITNLDREESTRLLAMRGKYSN
ncbi:hypothetical protein AT05_04055 [Schleiferia thermophila str. Yellowstone]|jgi:hypothetical protein|uniref:Uncharacterized protein n=1 Tax=Schleiferia thermophila TaxID=884107 RepID=A0A369A6U5_9FLAO|nr:hypothetical protein AT05_04055 [Schleiferia thermophila str. Yellowstone]RCX04885.1 hypothetical protein DES35_101155 [Schleiferia thermophila]